MPSAADTTISRLVELAYEFGPFLFAILILIYLTKRAHENYKEIAARTNPPPKTDELRARRRVYYMAWVAGFALVLISVTWWLFSHPPLQRDYIRFTVLNVPMDEELRSNFPGLFMKTNPDAPWNKHEFLLPLPVHEDEGNIVYIHYIRPDEDASGGMLYPSLDQLRSGGVFQIKRQNDEWVLVPLEVPGAAPGGQ